MPRALETAMTTAIARRRVAVIVVCGDVALQSGDVYATRRNPDRHAYRLLDQKAVHPARWPFSAENRETSQTRWRSGMNSNHRSRLFSTKRPIFSIFLSPRGNPIEVSGSGDRTIAA
jgi:hypothetical protein